MASFRRSLSLVPQHGSSANEEEFTIPSSLSKSSSFNSDHLPTGGLFPRSFSSLDYASSRVQSFVLGFFSKRSSRSLERLKSKGNSWRRALLHFFVCFLIGIFIGLTPFASPTFSVNLLAKHQVFSLEMLHQVDRIRIYSDTPKNVTSIVERVAININATSKPEDTDHEQKDGIRVSDHLSDQSLYEDTSISLNKLLIIVTTIYARPFQAYYLNRLAQTLRLVPPPLLWIVVEMRSQSIETAELLRNAGVMFRHLICKESLNDTKDRGMHLRNVALSHIEAHQLDGIIYFADDDNIYTLDLFDQMRQIRRLGTWSGAKLLENNMNVIMEGPICNGSQVIAWHLNDITNKFKRFHIEVSGFAFNSTILWDPKRWNRPLQPIRLLHTIEQEFQVSMFMEQIVEDENQIEGFPLDCSTILVWHLNVESLYSFSHENSTKKSLTPYWLNGV